MRLMQTSMRDQIACSFEYAPEWEFPERSNQVPRNDNIAHAVESGVHSQTPDSVAPDAKPVDVVSVNSVEVSEVPARKADAAAAVEAEAAPTEQAELAPAEKEVSAEPTPVESDTPAEKAEETETEDPLEGGSTKRDKVRKRVEELKEARRAALKETSVAVINNEVAVVSTEVKVETNKRIALSKGVALEMPTPNFSWIRNALLGNVETQLRAAEARAALDAVGTMGEDDEARAANVPWYTWARYRVFSRRHATKHRAANKLHKRVRILKDLKAQMVFTGGERNANPTPLQMMAANELAKRVIRDAYDEGLVGKEELGWYKTALTRVYFIQDEDDEFLSVLGSSLPSQQR